MHARPSSSNASWTTRPARGRGVPDSGLELDRLDTQELSKLGLVAANLRDEPLGVLAANEKLEASRVRALTTP